MKKQVVILILVMLFVTPLSVFAKDGVISLNWNFDAENIGYKIYLWEHGTMPCTTNDPPKSCTIMHIGRSINSVSIHGLKTGLEYNIFITRRALTKGMRPNLLYSNPSDILHATAGKADERMMRVGIPKFKVTQFDTKNVLQFTNPQTEEFHATDIFYIYGDNNKLNSVYHGAFLFGAGMDKKYTHRNPKKEEITYYLYVYSGSPNNVAHVGIHMPIK